MAAGTEIRVEGLIEFQKALKAADKNFPKQLRLMLNDVVVLVADRARPMVPVGESGRAAASIRPQSTQREGRVKAGGGKALYYPWLDFGGSVGIHKSVHRPFLKTGRYLYPAYKAVKPAIEVKLVEGIMRLGRESGLVME